MRLNKRFRATCLNAKCKLIYLQKVKNIVSIVSWRFFVSAFANGLIFNLHVEHNSLSFGGFHFGLFEKESKIARIRNMRIGHHTLKGNITRKLQLYKVFLVVCLHFSLLYNQKIV